MTEVHLDSKKEQDMIEVQSLIRSLGIHSTYKGFQQLAVAVSIARDHSTCLLGVTKYIYPEVAKVFNTSPGNVEHNLRTVIISCWERGNRERLQEIAGYRLLDKPTTKDFIDILACYLNHPTC